MAIARAAMMSSSWFARPSEYYEGNDKRFTRKRVTYDLNTFLFELAIVVLPSASLVRLR